MYASSIYRVHFLGTSRVLLYRDTIDRVLFYIDMTVLMFEVLKLVIQTKVEIFANRLGIRKNLNFSVKGKNSNFIQYLSDKIRKNHHHCLNDLMGTIGHNNGLWCLYIGELVMYLNKKCTLQIDVTLCKEEFRRNLLNPSK